VGRKLLATGIDPMAQRKSEKTAGRVASENSFSSVAARWMEDWQEGKSQRHVDYTRRRLASNILPTLGHLQAPKSRRQTWSPWLGPSKLGVRGTSQNVRLKPRGKFFATQSREGTPDVIPQQTFVQAILRPTRKLNYPRIEGRELSDLLKSIEVYQGKQITRLAIKLMALTFVGQRTYRC
jgi:hypothetical protein